MAYKVDYKDVGVDYPGSFTTERKEELMQHVEMHAKEAHPDLELSQEQVEVMAKITD